MALGTGAASGRFVTAEGPITHAARDEEPLLRCFDPSHRIAPDHLCHKAQWETEA
jgi:hypothetical protein